MKLIVKMAAVLAAVFIVPQYVYAYEIDARISTFTVTASLQSDTNTSRPTIQLLDGEKKRVIYMGEGTSSKNADKTYMFSFEPFSVPESLETGEYVIRIGGAGVETAEKRISFVNVNDKGNALNEINAAVDKTEAIIRNGARLGVDTSMLGNLNAEWKDVVNNSVSETDLSNDCSAAQVEEKYNVFLNAYMPAFEKAVIAGIKNAEIVGKMIDASTYLGIDRSGRYAELSDKTAPAAILAGKSFKTDITNAEIKNEFDGAVLVSVINQLDHGSAKSALDEYIAKGLLTLNMTEYNALSETNKANVFKDLKKCGINDYKLIPDNFTRLVNQYKTVKPQGGGGGGGSAGSGAAVVPNTIAPSPAPTDKPTEGTAAFSDMSGYEWAEKAVNELGKRGVINGDGNGKFYPKNYVTREEFAKIIVAAFGLYEETAEVSFGDVPKDSWFYVFVASAKKNGIVTGISDDEYGVGRNISRQDMAVMLKRVFDMAKCGAKGEYSAFGDYSQVSAYAKDAVSVLAGAGILNGTENGNFEPYGSVTRAQSAKAVYELLKLIEGN